jgi:hypothetical protein
LGLALAEGGDFLRVDVEAEDPQARNHIEVTEVALEAGKGVKGGAWARGCVM